jgi:hypothetical protein
MLVLAALNETFCEYVLLFFYLFTLCRSSASELQDVFNNSAYGSTAKWETCLIFEEDRLLVRVWRSICNHKSHFIMCIQSSSFQGYEGIHK